MSPIEVSVLYALIITGLLLTVSILVFVAKIDDELRQLLAQRSKEQP